MQDFFIEVIRPEHLLFYLFAYGLASTPTSYLVARWLHKIDVRKQSDFSHAASYVYTKMSKSTGALVFVLDLLKGLLPCAIALSLDVPLEIIALIGFFAVAGHCFSVWLWFSGGYGGATFAGVLFIVFWPAALAAIALNSLLIIVGMLPSTASVAASIVSSFVVFFFVPNKVVWSVVTASVAVIVIRRLTTSTRAKR